jgi:hypothetical protein
MDALGAVLEMAWLATWSVMATLFALRFNESSARFGGMPGRVWGALFLAWVWLALMPLWMQLGYPAWLAPITLLSSPVGMLLALVLALRKWLRERQIRQR